MDTKYIGMDDVTFECLPSVFPVVSDQSEKHDDFLTGERERERDLMLLGS